MYTVGLYTLGCKVSQYETECVREKFLELGFTVLAPSSVCDVYVINTCTVTAESDAKCRKYIRRALKLNPNATVAVMGCYSQRDPEALKRISGVSVIIGTDNKMAVAKACLDILQGKIKPPYISLTDLSHRDFEKMTLRRAERTRAYVKIEDGCDSKCTYCAIKNARGRVRSKPPAEVISEVEALYRGGTREIVLTGIETAAYGRDFGNGYNLASLIRELSERESCERIRLGSLAPELIGRDFAEGVRGVKILAPHFHLSIQSGSDNVLFRMKRRYSRNQLLLNIKLLKEAFPDATFTTDLMVGFPGETDADFELTLSLVREIGLLSAHVFIFSKREGTEAYSYTDTVSPAVAKRRSEVLISECNRVRDEILSDIVNKGESLSVIAETYDGIGYLSHSDTFVEVYFKSDCKNLQGEMLSVRPVSHKDGVIYAEI